MSPELKYVSPCSNTFRKIFFSVAFLSEYPAKSFATELFLIFPINTPGSPGLHFIHQPF